MTEPLRRRLRRRAIDALVRAPAPVARGLLGLACVASRATRFERRTRANLELALGASTGAAERARIAAGVRRHTARLALEWTRLARAGRSRAELERARAWLADAVVVDDSIRHLHAALGRGAGAILASAHVGNWELAAMTLRLRGIEGLVVGFEKRNDSSAEWLVELRRALAVETVPQHAPPRVLLESLRAGRCVGLLADLEARRLDGEVLPFFGVPAWTMRAPAALARASRAPIVPLACVAEGARYRLFFEPALEFDRAGPRDEAMRALGRSLNATFERWIRATPEQWAWHQRRWRDAAGLARLSAAAGARGASARGSHPPRRSTPG